MENRLLAWLQNKLTPAWKKICDGCCLDRETLSMLRDHNLSILKTENYYKGLFIAVEAILDEPN
jgi:hypothetical protein